MSASQPPAMGILSTVIFASRWLQLPLYLGLILAQAVYVFHFWVELVHLVEAAFGNQAALAKLVTSIGYKSDVAITGLNETIIMLVVLALIDVVMISNLLIMVIVGGYETFVSRLRLEGHPDQPEWLSHVNASVLKVKLATAIIGISSIHLLKTFINAANYDEKVLIWQTVIHIAFLFSALAIALADRVMAPAPGSHPTDMIELLQFAFGLGALVLGADVLVRGAARLALGWGLSPLVIGLTVVAFGTSAPEVAVSVGAALNGRTDIALGNVVGSNIFNILGILGLSALILPLAVNVQIIRQEVPVMIGASLMLALLALDGEISLADGALLFGLLIAYTGFLVVQSRKTGTAADDAEFAADIGDATATRPLLSAAMVAGGLVLLVAGAQALVAAATSFARELGLGELVIGLTIVAVGTSLPELATSIMAALRGQRDIAVGNIIGSNIFNILGCLGLTALVAGGGVPVAASVLRFDVWVMLAATLACLPIFITGRSIARWEGVVLLSYYAAYTVYLLLAAQAHQSIGVFSEVLIGFVAPLTLVALVASLMRSSRR